MNSRVRAAVVFAIVPGLSLKTLLAAELPPDLLAAARKLPPTSPLRRICAPFTGVPDQSGLPFQMGETSVFARGKGYDSKISGAYLGSVPATGEPPRFIAALIDAGVAVDLPVTWVQRTRSPAAATPRLSDTGVAASSAAAGQPSWTEARDTAVGHLYVVTGDDAELFGREAMVRAPVPPAAAGAAPNDITAPPGLWGSGSVCIAYQAQQVLEYAPPRSSGNGIRTAIAYVKFDAERFPAWLADQRVLQALVRPLRPFQFYAVAFRDDGDGWRVDERGSTLVVGPTTIVAP